MKNKSTMIFLLIDRDKFFEAVNPRRNEAIKGYNVGYSFGTEDDRKYGSTCGYFLSLRDNKPSQVELSTYAYDGMTGFEFESEHIDEIKNKKEREMMTHCVATLKKLADSGSVIIPE